MKDSEKSKLIREKLNFSQAKLAKFLGIPQSTIGQTESGKRNAGESYKFAFFKKFGMDFDTYNGEDLNIDERKNTVNTKPNNDVIKTNTNIIAIPLYEIGAAAGKGTWLTDEPDKEFMYFDKRFLKQILKTENFSGLHLIHASGDSMDSGWNQPNDIKDGDLLLVDTQQTTGNNQIFVILVNNSELRVKRLFKRGDALYISSNNPKYKEEVYYPDNNDFEVKVIGKVVWNGSKETV